LLGLSVLRSFIMFYAWVRLASVTIPLVGLSISISASAQDFLSEERAIELALQREGISQRDDADRAIGDAQVNAIGPFDNPSAQISREGAGGESEWQLGVVQPFDLNGRRSSLREAARADRLAIESDIVRRRQLFVAEVRKSYMRCAAARAETDIWKRYVGQIGEALRVSSARAKAGDTAVYDVRRVRVEQSGAEAQLVSAEGDQAANCIGLSSLTGVTDIRVEPAAMNRLSSIVTENQRPDIAAQEQRIIAASKRVRATEQARLPQLTIGAGILRRDDPTGTAYGPAVSLGVTLPIWDGGGPALRGAEAQRSALESELIIKRRNAEAEQQAAAIRAAAAREAAVAGARVREDAGRLGGIAEIAYQAGEIGVVELLDAYEAARDTNLSVIALALNAAESAVEYDVTTGRNYE
jgi:cobalt-zinc-cadmium efflux system outer membrane protein